MSVFKRKNSPYFQYDFQLQGVRFRGSTGKTSRREAEFEERARKEDAARQIERHQTADKAFRGQGDLTLSAAVARYWQEKGQFLAGSDTVWKNLERMVDHFGAATNMADIRDADVAAWVALRRGEKAWGKDKTARIQNGTVNRTTVDALRKVFGHARTAWKIRFPDEPTWSNHRLKERETIGAEVKRVDQVAIANKMGDGYRDMWLFALATGLRLAECFMTWSQIDMGGAKATLVQKGGGERQVILGRAAMAILAAQQGRDETHVFTYVCRRRGGKNANKKLVLGERYPVTYTGLKSAFRRAVARIGLNVRFHDARHTVGSAMTRVKGLKAAQRQLGHARIETTAKFYSHVLDDELRDALDAAIPHISPHSAESERDNKLKQKRKKT
ncbi:integrase [Rhodoblastus acidophilus]|uniref:tyrosine-type recombinase/integrase n=1 Tax=Rhodoblastus acidophilus TaxID=1074 RepID=UPI002223EF46|nr:tyrosine-type recombinase/integrase [Rhodoblastus acidophilus]MCW2317247.1 integrase [Rhodoblastus acidophilus]